MKKKQYNLWAKLRSAMRDVWRYSPQHRVALKDAELHGAKIGYFDCPICEKEWPIQMATVDHIPPLGSFDSWETFGDWTRRLFDGSVRVIDKICHKKATASQRKKAK